jgi:hypothetical protein
MHAAQAFLRTPVSEKETLTRVLPWQLLHSQYSGETRYNDASGFVTSNRVFWMLWNEHRDEARWLELPSLPHPLCLHTSLIVGSWLVVAGGLTCDPTIPIGCRRTFHPAVGVWALDLTPFDVPPDPKDLTLPAPIAASAIVNDHTQTQSAKDSHGILDTNQVEEEGKVMIPHKGDEVLDLLFKRTEGIVQMSAEGFQSFSDAVTALTKLYALTDTGFPMPQPPSASSSLPQGWRSLGKAWETPFNSCVLLPHDDDPRSFLLVPNQNGAPVLQGTPAASDHHPTIVGYTRATVPIYNRLFSIPL